MKKILFLTIIFLLTPIISFPKELKAINNNKKQQILKQINQVYITNPVIKSKFKQVDSMGVENYGWFVLDKKNSKARIEYTSIPLRIIINNNSLMMEQIDLKEKTFSPLISSPLKYIVSKEGNLSSPELIINKCVDTSTHYEITVSSKHSSIKGNVTLIFNLKYFLVGWIITDELGNKTQIFLLNPTYNSPTVPSYVFNTHRVTNINFNELK